MRKLNYYGLVMVLVCLLMFAPVAAWHADITKEGPATACPTCDYFTYKLTVDSLDWAEHAIRVKETLPPGLNLIQSSDAITATPSGWSTASYTISGFENNGQQIDMTFYDVPAHTIITIILKVKPSSPPASFSNTVTSEVQPDEGNWEGLRTSNEVITAFGAQYCPPVSSPEFPSMALPVGMIIGFLGIVFYIQRTREH